MHTEEAALFRTPEDQLYNRVVQLEREVAELQKALAELRSLAVPLQIRLEAVPPFRGERTVVVTQAPPVFIPPNDDGNKTILEVC